MSHQYTSAQTWEVKQLGGSITHLTWKGGDVVSMDMNGNPQLQFLECVVSTLVGLDVTGCTELRYLRVSNTALTSLNLSTNTKLRALEANKTKITQLDFTNNPLLNSLSCIGETDGSASLEAVDVTACSKLVSLNVRCNQLTELNIMNNPKLELLFANHNHLTSLRLAEGVVLKNVDLTGNSLDSTSIDHILLRLSQNGLENGEALLNQTPPAPPGSQGETAKQTLLQRGWTLQTD